MPDVQHQRMYLFLMAVAALFPLAVAGHLWLSGFQEVVSSRFFTLGLIYPLMSVVAGGLYYLNQMEDWQAISLLFTTAAGLMMEWSSSGFRGPQHASLGFWFWVPSITLLLLLSNRLAEIVKSDSESTASISTIHTSRNFYGVLRVRHEAAEDDDGDFIPAKKALTHGQIRHGFQFDDDYWKVELASPFLTAVSMRRRQTSTRCESVLWDLAPGQLQRMVNRASTSGSTTSIQMWRNCPIRFSRISKTLQQKLKW
jgi:hypothetical protein